MLSIGRAVPLPDFCLQFSSCQESPNFCRNGGCNCDCLAALAALPTIMIYAMPRPRFSLKTLLVVVTVCAVPLGCVLAWQRINWCGHGLRDSSPDGNYSAEMTSWERFVGEGRRYATFVVQNTKTSQVIWRKEFEIPSSEGYLVCGKPGQIKWENNSSSVVFNAMRSDATLWLQIHVDINGAARRRWIVSGQPPHPHF
jgi:hypothetical protein